MNKIVINGQAIETNGKNVSIVNNQVKVDGKLLVISDNYVINVEIYGDCGDIDTTGNVIINGNCRDIDSTGNVTCYGLIKGDVDCVGNVIYRKKEGN